MLKNPIKREEYDHKIKVKNMKSNEKKGSDFSHEGVGVIARHLKCGEY